MVGLIYDKYQRMWVWPDGSRLSYANWWPGQPDMSIYGPVDDSQHMMQCVYMYLISGSGVHNGKWFNTWCEDALDLTSVYSCERFSYK